MDHNGTRPTTTSRQLPSGMSGELRDWYSLGVGADKFVYAGRVYGFKNPKFPDGHKLFTGYIVALSITVEATIIQDVDGKQWICYAEHQYTGLNA